MLLPNTETELSQMVRDAAGPLLIQGNDTKASMLRPVQAAATLSTKKLTGITLYAPNELVMSAKSGTKLSEIEAALAAKGQQMIAEPTHLFGEHQTIGGVVAANLSGPRRITGGAMRDHVLGVRAVNGDGEILNFGGRVLKNVTGLDIAKLLTGSYGTLAIMTEITFKVLPIAPGTGTLAVPAVNAGEAVQILAKGLGSPFGVSGAAYLPSRHMAYLRIEDFEDSVAYRCDKLKQNFGGASVLDTAQSYELWRTIRDCTCLDHDEALWRISVSPSAGPAVLDALMPHGITGYLDWGGGLLVCTGPATEAAHIAVCNAANASGGVWWLLRAPESLRAAVDVIPPASPALAAIRRRVQHAFDPRGIFNPLKMQAA